MKVCRQRGNDVAQANAPHACVAPRIYLRRKQEYGVVCVHGTTYGCACRYLYPEPTIWVERSEGSALRCRTWAARRSVAILEEEDSTPMPAFGVVKPAIWGAIVGAAAAAIIGFTWGGWVTAKTELAMASRQSQDAVVKALAPYCVERFEQLPDATAQWKKLKKADDYDQGGMLEKLGVATLPGSRLGGGTRESIASACANKLVAMKRLGSVKSASAGSAKAASPSRG